jgi:anti-sigma B factor antagonist
MQLKVATKTKDGILIVDCSGRIVFGEESSLLRETVKKAISENNRIVLNLGEVNYIDSGGLGHWWRCVLLRKMPEVRSN